MKDNQEDPAVAEATAVLVRVDKVMFHQYLHLKVMMVETLVVQPLRIEAVAAAALVLLVGMVHHLEQEKVVLVFKF